MSDTKRELPLVPDPSRGEKQIGKFIITSEKLGSGRFGRVYLAYDSTTGEKAAVKVVDLTKNRDHAAQDEVYQLRKLNHPNVIRLLEQQKNEKYLVMIFEFCGGGDLERFVRSHGPLPEPVARRFFRQLVEGLAYLDSVSMLHRDLKPANCLLTSTDMLQATLKIADLGFAKTTSQLAESTHGTPFFMAPERLLDQPYGFAAEIFAAGLILFEMLTGRGPFQANTRTDLIVGHRAERHTADPLVARVSDDAKDVLRRTLKFRPNDRITIDELLKHPFVQNGGAAAVADPGQTGPIAASISPLTPMEPQQHTAAPPTPQDQSPLVPPPGVGAAGGGHALHVDPQPASTGSPAAQSSSPPRAQSSSEGDAEIDLDAAREAAHHTQHSTTRDIGTSPAKTAVSAVTEAPFHSIASPNDDGASSSASPIFSPSQPRPSAAGGHHQNTNQPHHHHSGAPQTHASYSHTATTAGSFRAGSFHHQRSLSGGSTGSGGGCGGSARIRGGSWGRLGDSALGTAGGIQTNSFANMSMILNSVQEHVTSTALVNAKLVRAIAYEELDAGRACVLFAHCCRLIGEARRYNDEARSIYKECYDLAHHNKQVALQERGLDLDAKVRPVSAIIAMHVGRLCEMAASEEVLGRTTCGPYDDSIVDVYSAAITLVDIALAELSDTTPIEFCDAVPRDALASSRQKLENVRVHVERRIAHVNSILKA